MGPTARRLVWPAAMAGVAALLVVLALLQYRWATQISDNEQDRMRTQLRTATGQFRQDFYRDLVVASSVFQGDPELMAEDNSSRFRMRYEEWLRNPANSEIVSNVYLWKVHAPKDQQELKLDRQQGAFTPATFPQPVKTLLAAAPWGAPGGSLRRIAWTFDAALPGLIRPIYRSQPGSAPPRDRPPEPPQRERERDREVELAGAMVIELNSGFITRQLFPALVQRHLNITSTSYHVTVFSTLDPTHPLFESGPKPGGEVTAPAGDAKAEDKPDAEIGLIESPFVQNRGQGPRGRRPGDAALQPVLRRYAMTFPAAIIPGPANWRLAVRHPAGSLKAAVDATRRANLMISFGTLIVLAGSIFLLFAAMHRTRTLARMQMEFVAGVSHELRTPVSVICSAGDNLAEGVVDGKQQVQNYGQLIRGEARRLAAMVEQILLFSAGKQDTPRYNLQPVDLVSVIDGVLRDTAPGIASAGITLERAIDADLPHVMADGGAVARCLENLVSNAIKYGAAGHWLRVSAATVESRNGGGRLKREVAIAVEDHGMGIPSSDLRRIFEPFYRGKSAQDSQIHGTGLGLSLARKLARAMRGDIRVESEPGHGSRFVLTLPAADMPAVTEQETVNEPVHTAD